MKNPLRLHTAAILVVAFCFLAGCANGNDSAEGGVADGGTTGGIENTAGDGEGDATGTNAEDMTYPTYDDWKASYVNIQGVPFGENKYALVTISQTAKGATADCTGCENVYITSVAGTTSFYCLNYQMTPQSITNMGSATLEPEFDDPPTGYIEATYQVSAYTSVRPNIYSTHGKIRAN